MQRTRRYRSATVTARIVRHARRCGADLAGIAPMAGLAQSPSYRSTARRLRGKPSWSVAVIAIAHSPQEAWLDWWDGRNGGTPGNRRLIKAADRLHRWMRRELGLAARALPYPPDNGGIFLKDAAVLAGLGTIGRNNLLITPRYGPRVRLRGLRVEGSLRATGPKRFNPCRDCVAPCLTACPVGAFRQGRYERSDCERRMDSDIAGRSPGLWPSNPEPVDVIRYCRACELACPTGPE